MRTLHAPGALRALILALPLAVVGCSQRAEPVNVNIAAINDFHGNLLANPLTVVNAGAKETIKAGGAEALSGLLVSLRKQDPQLMLIGGGDMIGGSPPISSMWADEPTLKAMGLLGLQFSVIGNHELDQGATELMRQVKGGCDSNRPDKACQFDKPFPGSPFPYIAANLVDDKTGKPLFDAYRIEEAHGARIAFVGAVLRDVASVVSAKGMTGLRTLDEADAINAQLPALKAQHVDAVVAVIHQGGGTPEGFDKVDCSQLKGGEILDVVKRLDPSIRVVVTAHSHQGYTCRVDGRLVTQAASYGRLLTYLTLKVDPATHTLLDAQARNLVVDPRSYSPTPQMAALVSQVRERSQAVLDQPIARLASPKVQNRLDRNGESPLGDLIADSQLAATRAQGAQLALMNLGGIRADLLLDAGQTQVNYAQLATIQPFGNTLVTMTLTGEQLRELLEQQWKGSEFNPLQVSSTLNYQWDSTRSDGQHLLPGSLKVDGQPVSPEGRYRLTVNSFMADGGDKFSVLAQGTERVETGISDLRAMIDYLKAADQAGTPAGQGDAAQRFTRQDARVAEVAR